MFEVGDLVLGNVTKRVFKIKDVAGCWILVPAGSFGQDVWCIGPDRFTLIKKGTSKMTTTTRKPTLGTPKLGFFPSLPMKKDPNVPCINKLDKRTFFQRPDDESLYLYFPDDEGQPESIIEFYKDGCPPKVWDTYEFDISAPIIIVEQKITVAFKTS